MSWGFNGNGAFELTGLSLAPGELTICAWVKSASGKVTTAIDLFNGGDSMRAKLAITSDAGCCDGDFRRENNTGVQPLGAVIVNYGWAFIAAKVKLSTTSAQAWNEGTGGTENTSIGFSVWNSTFSTLRIGVPKGSTSYASTPIAHVAIYDKYLSEADLDDLHNGGVGGGGKNPTAVQNANLIYYLYDNADNTYVGGYNMSDLGTAPTWSTGDTPTVDEPTSGQSVVPILMSHYN